MGEVYFVLMIFPIVVMNADGSIGRTLCFVVLELNLRQ